MDYIGRAAEIIGEASNIVALTGAGASTESNIPDFRSSRSRLEEIQKKYGYPSEVLLSHGFFEAHPDVFYDYYRNYFIYKDARPNDCHKSLVRLEALGKLAAVVTQNIDGLHHEAGSRNVVELHGSVLRNYCTSCGKRFGLEFIEKSPELIPKCDGCRGIVRPDVVLYGEMLDEKNLERAISSIEKADVMLVIGTSLVVHPAAGLLDYYKGKKLILINRDATPYDQRADVIIHDNAGDTMKQIVSSMT